MEELRVKSAIAQLKQPALTFNVMAAIKPRVWPENGIQRLWGNSRRHRQSEHQRIKKTQHDTKPAEWASEQRAVAKHSASYKGSQKEDKNREKETNQKKMKPQKLRGRTLGRMGSSCGLLAKVHHTPFKDGPFWWDRKNWMNSLELYNGAFASGSKALNRLKAINKNAHNRMTCLNQPAPAAQRQSGKWLHRRDKQRSDRVPTSCAKKRQGAAQSLELASR